MAAKTQPLEQVNRDDENVRRDAAYVIDALAIEKDSRGIDFCCGNGLVTVELARGCRSITGLDFSPNLVAAAVHHASRNGVSNCDFRVADITHTGLESDCVDFACCLTSFHYFPDYDYAVRVVSETLRILKPGGRLLVTDVPRKGSLGYFLWTLVRNPDPAADCELIEMQPTRPFLERVAARQKLLFRRITGKAVESDKWKWFPRQFFERLSLDALGAVRTFPSQRQRGMLNYRFDLLLQKRAA